MKQTLTAVSQLACLVGVACALGGCCVPCAAPREEAAPVTAPEAPPANALPEGEIYTFWHLSDKISFAVVLEIQRTDLQREELLITESGVFTAFDGSEARAWPLEDIQSLPGRGPHAYSFTAEMLDRKRTWSFQLRDIVPGRIGTTTLTSTDGSTLDMLYTYAAE
ncbi:MAG TPA: hypothetical protein VFF65_07450 [Phycisphaerales bacterium]|nr:hypothetical protein [Phycisphaerales bacterium]